MDCSYLLQVSRTTKIDLNLLQIYYNRAEFTRVIVICPPLNLNPGEEEDERRRSAYGGYFDATWKNGENVRRDSKEMPRSDERRGPTFAESAAFTLEHVNKF